jgi:hypothetical protein
LFTHKVIDGVAFGSILGMWQGRFSVVNNKMYPVMWSTPQGGIDFRAPYGLKEEQAAVKRGLALPPEAKQYGWKPVKGSKRMEPAEFGAVIERLVKEQERTRFLLKEPPLKPVKNADFNDPESYRGAKIRYEEEQKRQDLYKKMYPNGVPTVGKGVNQ